MTLSELLDNPDYTNANTATKRAIFEKYSKDDENYTGANSATKAAIREKFGLGGVNVRDTAKLPEKVTDFSLSDWGNLVKQSIGEATDIINQGQRKPIVGPAVMAGVGELVKSAGAVGELATDKAQPITQAGQFLTESAKEVNPVAGTVGQVGSYLAPYNLAGKAIKAVRPGVGMVGEMTGSGALVGGLTTPGSAEERLQEAATQAALGGGTTLALKGAGAAYQGGKNFGRGFMEGVENPTWSPTNKTAFANLGETYYPQSAVKPWQQMAPAERVAGLPALEATQQPTAGLFTTPAQKIAKAFAETSPTGGTLVPHQGQVLQAFGEQTARDIINKPIQTAAANMLGPVLGGLVGGPIGAIAGMTAMPKMWKAAELAGLGKLSKTAALQPGFPQQLAQARAASAFGAQQAAATATPRLGYTPPVAGPVSPGTMYVAPEGVAGTNINAVSQAGAMQKYAPQPTAPVAPVAPQPTAPQGLRASISPEQQAAIDKMLAAAQETVAQRAQQVMGDRYRAPKTEQPVAGPVAPAELPPAPVAAAPVVETPVSTPTAGKTMTEFEKYENTHKQYGGTWDHENKTVTFKGDEMEASAPTLMYDDKFYDSVLPKNIEWTKTIEQWNPAGSDVLSETWYSSAGKKSPQYKFVESLKADVPSELYKMVGGQWEKVLTPFEKAKQEAITQKLSGKTSHEISYTDPSDGSKITDIKSPGRNEIVLQRKNGNEIYYIQQNWMNKDGTPGAQYIERFLDKNGQVVDTQTFDTKPDYWPKRLLE